MNAGDPPSNQITLMANDERPAIAEKRKSYQPPRVTDLLEPGVSVVFGSFSTECSGMHKPPPLQP